MLKIASLLTVVAMSLAACGQEENGSEGQPQAQPEPAAPEAVAVTSIEYEFQGVPATLEAGETNFTMENKGDEPHEFALALVKSDASIEELINLPEKDLPENIEQLGRAFAKPGASGEMVAELEPGRYAYVCFEPSPEGAPHAFLGMAGEFTVA
jgi:uncharacterized cupredoxin-like copper-binding protein